MNQTAAEANFMRLLCHRCLPGNPCCIAIGELSKLRPLLALAAEHKPSTKLAFTNSALYILHRLVNNALAEELKTIHAFSQKTFTPEQWAAELAKRDA